MLLNHEPPLLRRRHLDVAGDGSLVFSKSRFFRYVLQVSQRHGQTSLKRSQQAKRNENPY